MDYCFLLGETRQEKTRVRRRGKTDSYAFLAGIEIDFTYLPRLRLGGSRKAFEPRANEAIDSSVPFGGRCGRPAR